MDLKSEIIKILEEYHLVRKKHKWPSSNKLMELLDRIQELTKKEVKQ